MIAPFSCKNNIRVDVIRGVFRTHSKICDDAFLQKYLTAFSRSLLWQKGSIAYLRLGSQYTSGTNWRYSCSKFPAFGTLNIYVLKVAFERSSTKQVVRKNHRTMKTFCFYSFMFKIEFLDLKECDVKEFYFSELKITVPQRFKHV